MASIFTPKPLWDGFAYKPHQTIAVEWMLKREAAPESGGLLCDEMGLGKTMEVLGTIKNSSKLQTLLLCPKAVVTQWRVAAMKSGFSVFELDNLAWKPTQFRAGQRMIFIANYDKIDKRRHTAFFGRKWNRVVLDEAHRIRNRDSRLFGYVNRLDRQTIWAVTATPVVNTLKDIRNLFGLVGYNLQKLTNYTYLQNVVSEALLYRSMDEMRALLPELPAAPVITRELLDFETDEEAEFYRGIQGNIVRRWRALERDQTSEMFVMIMRLRQLSLHPQVYINARKREWIGYDREDWTGTSTKFAVLRKKLEDPTTPPSRWIVFCQFHDEMDILEEYLSSSPAVSKIWQYHGGMSDEKKDDVLEETQTPLGEERSGALPEGQGKHQVLLLQLHSGGVGLNLQHFNKIIFMSPWWTAALLDQAIGRAVRIGQEKLVDVTMIVLKEEDSLNIDDMMLKKVDGKRGLLETLFQAASKGIEKEDVSDASDAESVASVATEERI